ncbi:MAG: glutamate mutase L [Anaerolineales bacterium]|nr:glutamate mutase L [Anaerolineales bacterium]
MTNETDSNEKKRRVMAGSIGDCVHSLGVETFAEWMEDRGEKFVAVKLGPAVPIQDVINKIREARPEIVAISMRLGDLHVDKLISEFIVKAAEHQLLPRESGIRYAFGGLRPAANLVRAMTGMPVQEDKFSKPGTIHYNLDEIAENYGDIEAFQHFFGLVVDDYITMEELEAFASGEQVGASEQEIKWEDNLPARVKQVRELEGRPIIRAHIGIAADSIEPTIKAVEMLADAQCLEIVSLAPDQPSQAHLAKFIRGEEDPDKYLKGQGGVPIRTREDLMRLKKATRRGNYPMTRIYSGTDELVELAKLFEGAFNMPFPAVPIFFYNELDGRGPISIRDSFDEHFEVMRWWASRNKAVEINDPHQWQLRNSTDDLLVTDHVLAGVVALKMGIRKYIMQMMYDLPPGTSGLNDLAKFQGAYELMEPLTRHFDYQIIKETRGGLSDFPPNLDKAKGHLAVSTYWQMYTEPDIVHVVSFSEAHHEAKAQDVIESCDIVKQVFEDFYNDDRPDIWADPRLLHRKKRLKVGAMYNLLHLSLLGGYEGPVTLDNFFEWTISPEEARQKEYPREWERNYETMLLSFIDEKNYPTGQCGMISPDTLDLALQVGLFQAPQITVLDRRYELVGKCRTKIVEGGCVIDELDGVKVQDEIERVDLIRQRSPWFFDKNISHADEDLGITEVAESMDEDVVRRAQRQVGIQKAADLDNKKVLVVDFGSTFSKIGVFDTKTENFEMKYVPTIVDDLRESLANGLDVLEDCQRLGNWEPLRRKMEQFDIKLPCSSAKGGLKMITVSMVKEESGFAAELAALTAGAKLLNNYDGKLSEEQVQSIYQQDQPEIILQVGGVDRGGDTETQLHNARLLARNSKKASYARYGVPVIYAGNQDIAGEIDQIYRKEGVDIRLTPNVMPEINTFRIEVVNEAIRELFQTIIIRGKGFDVVEEYMSAPFLPTPRAAFRGINLLAKGFGKEPGLGNIIALDIGGATTDFYSNVNDNPLYRYMGNDPLRKVKRTILKTPNTPLAYRRVEGKYGMAYDAENIKELDRFQNGSMKHDLEDFMLKEYPDFKPGNDEFGSFSRRLDSRLNLDLDRYLSWLTANPHVLPSSDEENAVRSFLAKEIMAATTGRNVGYVKETDTYFLQYGVNFLNQPCTTLLIGGAIYHKCKAMEKFRRDLRLIADGTHYNENESWILRPKGKVLLDAAYMVSIVGGLYGRIDPERALRMMKRNLLDIG